MANRTHLRALTTFFVLACTFTWALLPLTRTSLVFSLVALLGPAAAALITAGLGGREQLFDLWRRVATWRVPVFWYLAALLLPLIVSGLRSCIEYVLGATGPVRLQPITALGLTVFVLVAGEEVGWRGFALPRLLSDLGPWTASAIVGVLWALWHLPLFFMPGMPQFGIPLLSYVPYLIALSIILTILHLSTEGSVVIATLFHGAVNTFGIVNAGASPLQRGWGNALAYGAAALLLGILAWNTRASRRRLV